MSVPSNPPDAINDYLDDGGPNMRNLALHVEGFASVNRVDRRISLRWMRTANAQGDCFTAVIELSGAPGSFYHTPKVEVESNASHQGNVFYALKESTREERRQIMALAEQVKFDKESGVSGCRAYWMRDLLQAMVKGDLIKEETFNGLVVHVPLEKPLVDRPGGLACTNCM